MVNSRDEMIFEGVKDFIKEQCFSLEVNMNDTFYWGCADSERISVYDLDEVLRLYRKHGSAGLDAFVIAKRREQGQDKSFFYSDDIIGYYSAEYLTSVQEALLELQEYEVFPGSFKEFGIRFCDD